MKTKVDPNMPIGKLTQIPDFLPRPEELVFSKPTVKVTLSLTKDSVDFFKKKAKRHGTQYQKMIRELVDRYAHQF